MIEISVAGAIARVDDQDAALVAGFNWWLHSAGYACAKRGGRQIYMHRLIVGVTERRLSVDHINHDKLDNRRANLRVGTQAENGQNRIGARGTSQYRGVCWNKRTGKWQAQQTLHRRNWFLGLFDDEEEAARVAAVWRSVHMPFADPDARSLYRVKEEEPNVG